MTVDAVVYGLRIYVIVVATIVAVLGTFQLKRWHTYLVENQLAWMALALMNLSAFIGCLESILRDVPGGTRTYVVALAVTFELQAVAFHPVRALWRHLRVRRIAKRAAANAPIYLKESP